MSELVIARIKRELAAVDGFNNDLYGSLADGSNSSLHRWVEIWPPNTRASVPPRSRR